MDRSSVHLPNFITGYYGPRSSSSRAFQALVRGIGEVKSKHEEGRIIREEFQSLREKLGQQSSPKQMREYLLRLIYCEMLGIDASDFHIHAINFAQQKNLMDKRIGYLALSLFLHENHPLLVLLINTLQRDLKSTNILEKLCALTAVSKLVNAEMLPAIIQQVLALLEFKRDIIRKKAVMALHCLYQKCPSMVPDIEERALKALKDRDFGVASASLHICHDLILEEPAGFKHLVPVFVAFQQKIVSSKLDKQFDYHGIPCPWVQIKILKILALLGADDQKASSQMYDVVNKTISSLNTGALIGYAIAYECCRTITIIYPNKQLIDKAAKCVGLFLVAKSNDIKYLGITALAALVQVNSSLAAEPAYQRIVIDCLDDPDETLKRKTLDLLCRITNATNVETVCEKLIHHLRLTNDTYFRSELVARVTELAERYAPDNSWYILTMNEVLELGGGLVRPEVAHNLMRLIAEGNDDEESDAELRRFAVLSYLDLLEKPVLPDILVQVICWVTGEYSYVASECEPDAVLEQLCSLLDRKFQESATKRWVVSAIGKLIAQVGQLPDSIGHILDRHAMNGDIDLRQRVHELHQLSLDRELKVKVLPVDASCEDLEVDSSLSCLDAFVADALAHGAAPYRPKAERERQTIEKGKPDTIPILKYQPYEPPRRRYQEPTTVPSETADVKQEAKPPKQSKRRVLDNPPSSSPTPPPTVKGPWGPSGYSNKRGGSGSGDSGSRSDSSSKSSGSERIGAVRTRAEATPSPLVFSHEDSRKQQLANELFKGVGAKDESPLPGRKTTPHRGSGRASRPQTRNKSPWQPPDPGKPPALPPRPGAPKGANIPEMDLLLNFGSANNDATKSTDLEEQQQAINDGNKNTLETGQRIDCIQTELGNEINMVLTNSENSELVDNPESSTHEGDLSSSGTLLTLNDVTSLTPSCRENIEVNADHVDEVCLGEAAEANGSSRQTELKASSKVAAASLLDADISEQFAPLSLSDDNTPQCSLPPDLTDYPHSKDLQELCCDANLRVTSRKVYKPDQLVLVIYLTNQGQGNSPVTNVVSVLEPPSNLRAMFDTTTENRLCDEVLEPLNSVSHSVFLNFKSPALHMNFGGKITYKDSTNTLKNMFFNCILTMSDLLRPLALSADEFGTKWSQSAFDKRTNIASTVKSCEEFLKRAEEELSLYPVGIVGSKAIASGTVLGSGICLLHGSLSTSGTLELWTKTSSQLLSEAIMKRCTAVYQR